jgi:hypothetical protein
MDDKENTSVFNPFEVDYNPLRQQAHRYILKLQDPRAVQNVVKYTIMPTRIRSFLRGDEA